MQKAARGYFKEINWERPFAATLTYKQGICSTNADGQIGWFPLTSTRASENYRHFINLLSAAALPKGARRAGKRIRSLPVLEGHGGTRLHYHAMIDCPRADLAETFPQLITDCWQRTDWGHDKVHVTDGPNEGWLRYMTKLRSKPDFASSIDWMNITN